MAKKKKVEKIKKESYVSKPSRKRFTRAYKKAGSPEVASKISNIYAKKEEAYNKQKAQILTGEKPSKIKAKSKEQLERIGRIMDKAARTKMVSRQVLRKSNIIVEIPEKKAPSILGDENRFFKGEFDREKKRLFFS